MTVRPHIPMSSPDITVAKIEAVNQVLKTPYLSLGPRIAEFEERFAAYVGARHAIAVSSGTYTPWQRRRLEVKPGMARTPAPTSSPTSTIRSRQKG